MFEVIILIPRNDNNGLVFDGEFVEFETLAVASFGGISRLPGNVAGKWADGETVYLDTLVVFVIAVRGIGQGGEVARLAKEACRIFRQEAVYIRYLGIAEIIS